MLRLLIGTGFLLMAVGFGAAGWQYWQGLRAASDAAEELAALAVDTPVWLISPTGAIVAEEDSRAFLMQDQLVAERMVRLTTTARLDALLVQGESLPAAPYLEVLADIRAPRLGQSLCPILTANLAVACAVHSARVVPGTVNAAEGNARFTIALAFRQDVSGSELPDLSTHVLETEDVLADPAFQPATVEAALTGLVTTTLAACAADDRASTCRVLGLSLDWAPGEERQGSARIAWLDPLPDGMTRLSPIEPPPEGQP
jgi:hypothetical protein